MEVSPFLKFVAKRTVRYAAVMSGGAAGTVLTGSPFGGAAGGVLGGAAADIGISYIEQSPSGRVADLVNMVKGDNRLYAGLTALLGLATDAVIGYFAGEWVMRNYIQPQLGSEPGPGPGPGLIDPPHTDLIDPPHTPPERGLIDRPEPGPINPPRPGPIPIKQPKQQTIMAPELEETIFDLIPYAVITVGAWVASKVFFS